MKLKTFASLSLSVLIGIFATVQHARAQVPCSPTIIPNPSLFINWPQYGYDAVHSNCNPYESTLRPDNVANLTQDWQNASINATASPVVSDGMVFGSYFDSVHDVVYAYGLNASTGAPLRRYPIGDHVLSPPAVWNGKLYLLTYSGLEVFDVNTTALLWSYSPLFSGFGGPTIVNGVLYTVAVTGTAYAFNATTGAVIWQSTAGTNGGTSPAVANGMVYVGSQDNNLYALNASTGALVWKYTTGGWVYDSSPAVASGKVFFGSRDHNIYALNATIGALVWKYTTGGGQVISTPAVARGVVYIGSDDKNLYALDAATGALIWKYAASYEVERAPAVANAVVYFADFNGNAYALNAQTGALLWENTAGARVDSPAVVANGILYFNSGPPGMYAFHLPNQ
jgi:outer membrane protein assembly factor BamB